jgi:hypothetical protein
MQTRRGVGLVGAAAWLMASLACDPGAVAVPTELVGEWGGPGIVVVASHDSVMVRLDCSQGSMDAPVGVSRDGTFTAQGSWASELAPLAGSRPATYEGRLDGDRMELSASVEGLPGAVGASRVGPLVAVRGAGGQVTYCR